ncbi:cohesin domain-containing protein [Patescibacteria group bacterium]
MKEKTALKIKGLLIFGYIFIFLFIGLLFLTLQPKETKAQSNPEAKLFLSPSTGSFLVGSTFDISIIVDTGNVPVNAIKADLKFPADKIQIVSPSSGKSFISIWLEQPAYSNTEGTISFAGGTPDGINTSSGVISTITFRTIKAGEAIVKILPSSSVLAHDGKGTEILSKTIEGRYILKPKPPEGPVVFSQTHPDETRWYNNNNPIISWERETDVKDFSFVLDSYPQSVPDNTPNSQETTKAFEDLTDGLWYFHIKAKKEDVWGAPSHFLLRIDTTPPASFKPRVEFLLAAIVGRAFVSFSSTDALSGIDHYEVAMIDRTEPPLKSPVFIEAESPYQLPKLISEHLRISVRAADRAGNVRDEYVDADLPTPILSIIKWNLTIILLSTLVLSAYLIIRFLPKQKLFALLGRTKKDVLERPQQDNE